VIPTAALNQVALGIMQRYIPLGNTSPSTYAATVVTRNEYDQGGAASITVSASATI
jgi:hypothetical protein